MLTALAASLLLNAAPAVYTVELKPVGCEFLVDGKKKGTAAADKPIVVKLTAGKHVFRVVYKGDAHEEEVVVKAGEKKPWKWEFTGVGEELLPQ